MELFLTFAILSILGLFAYAAQIWAVRSYSCSPATPSSGEGDPSPTFFPPVSILKPLKGLDDKLFDNLESFCLLDYPEYEIIFALQNENDPACKVARKIKEKHPDKNITIHVERCSSGLNPKVNNLIPAYRISAYPFILISDSNVMADR